MNKTSKCLIVIGGPTASGKTKLAIELAKHYSTEIINADSRQFYREMTIGTAVPSADELAEIKHYFVQSHSVFSPLTAADFETEAHTLLKKLFKKQNYVVLCGGSGLYIKALAEGLDPLPPVDEDYRAELEQILALEGVAKLAQMLKEKDPQKAEKTDLKNPRRLIRILEILHTAGTEAPEKVKKPRAFEVISLFLNPDRQELYQKIDSRVDLMMKNGLLDEVKRLMPHRELATLQTLGYSELFVHIDGQYTLVEAIEKIKQHSRNYAKRQLTWFRNQGQYRQVANLSEALSVIESR